MHTLFSFCARTTLEIPDELSFPLQINPLTQKEKEFLSEKLPQDNHNGAGRLCSSLQGGEGEEEEEEKSLCLSGGSLVTF